MAKVKTGNQTAGKKGKPAKGEAVTQAKPNHAEAANQDSLLDQDQAAEFLNMKPSTLNTWRALRKGPKYHKVGRSVRYRMSDLVAFVEGGVVEPLVPVCQ